MKKVSGIEKMDEAAKRRMAAFSEVPNEEIDLSDIPEWTADDFKKSVSFRSLWKPRKEMLEEQEGEME